MKIKLKGVLFYGLLVANLYFFIVEDPLISIFAKSFNAILIAVSMIVTVFIIFLGILILIINYFEHKPLPPVLSVVFSDFSSQFIMFFIIGMFLYAICSIFSVFLGYFAIGILIVIYLLVSTQLIFRVKYLLDNSKIANDIYDLKVLEKGFDPLSEDLGEVSVFSNLIEFRLKLKPILRAYKNVGFGLPIYLSKEGLENIINYLNLENKDLTDE